MARRCPPRRCTSSHRQPLITTLLIGARDVDEMRADVAMLAEPVDPALWVALSRAEGLLLLP